VIVNVESAVVATPETLIVLPATVTVPADDVVNPAVPVVTDGGDQPAGTTRLSFPFVSAVPAGAV
jgi:hypothetical protein